MIRVYSSIYKYIIKDNNDDIKEYNLLIFKYYKIVKG